MESQIDNRFQSLGGLVPVGQAFVPLSPSEVTSLEEKLGIALPVDYRSFLLSYGAAMFGEEVEMEPISKLPEHISSDGKAPFSCFYGARCERHQSLEKKIDVFRYRMPTTMIPIAHDGGGNQICLGISGKERDRVYYWDREMEPDESEYLEDTGKPMPVEEKMRNVHVIADSFRDFVQRLKIIE